MNCPNPQCKTTGIPDDAKFCPKCGATINKSVVYIYGYTEWYLIKHDVRVFLNNKEVARVGRNELIELNIDKSCTLEFRSNFRPTRYYVKVDPGDYIVLSTNRFTGSLKHTVTTGNHINEVLNYR